MMLSNLKKKKNISEGNKQILTAKYSASEKKASFTKLGKQKKPNAACGKALPWC